MKETAIDWYHHILYYLDMGFNVDDAKKLADMHLGGEMRRKNMMEMTDTKKEGTSIDLGRICAECYFFTKKGDQRNCENEYSEFYGKPVDSTQHHCGQFEAYWW